jgi:hypothetical protein
MVLIVCKVSKATEAQSDDVSRDFKILLMYFSEAFLKGAVFDGKRLEGDTAIAVASSLVQSIEIIEEEYPKMTDLGDLIRFKKQLAAGIQVALDIVASECSGDVDTLRTDAILVQNKFCDALKSNDGLVMPIGWIGHALSMVIKPGKVENTFDFAVINTGTGLQFHYHAADPNGVYPRISQIWIEFANVKAEELFSGDAWFFQGLIALKKEFFAAKLKNLFTEETETELPDYFSEYFYGSFLTNFKNNLVPHRADKLIPMQRSGSCSVSSLIGALLYCSKSEANFYLHRLKIGHSLIKLFLAKAKGDDRFKTIIKDGFETNGRNFLKVIGSSLAQKTLEYLEFALPEYFKHAGLIGSERVKWIFEKKEAANKALMEADAIVYETIETSAHLIKEIMDFLKNNPISTSSNEILITEEIKGQFNSFEPELDKKKNNRKYRINLLSKHITSLVNETSIRSEEPLRSFSEFYDALNRFVKLKEINTQVFYEILNVFQRAHVYGKDHFWLEEGTKDQLLYLLGSIRNVVRSFASIKDKLISFDDIVLLTYLQKLSWKLATAYDQRLEEASKIGLESLAAPQTIQSILFGFPPVKKFRRKKYVFSENFENWIFRNIFDQKNFEIFMELLKLDEMENEKTRFMGPESFCDVYGDPFKPKLPEKNLNVYLKMMENPAVETILGKFRSNIKWSNMEQSHAKFLIVFGKAQSLLFHYFPHYYILMDTLYIIRLGTLESGIVCNAKPTYWTTDKHLSFFDDPNEIKPSCKLTQLIFGHLYENSCPTNVLKLCNMRGERHKKQNIFYSVRHSLALGKPIDIVGLETWFNYVKGSSNARIFDSAYFQYITDHLLNVPKFEDQHNIIFPVDELEARSIIYELSRLINASLETIKIRNLQISAEKRKTLIRRAVSLSVILIRFISRIDSVNILTGCECAKYLAQIYNFMIPFASFKSDYILAEQEISRINFAMAHICSVPIRNALTFMNNIHLETNQKGLRKTLKRYHWFAAKKSYIISGIGIGVADDQFNYGTSESPMTSREVGFLKEILIKYFLSGFINEPSNLNANDYDFRYNYRLLLVNIKIPSLRLDIVINLWTGMIVWNGLRMINNNIFLNSQKFQNFFAPDDMSIVSTGITAEAAGKSIYAVPDFKGVSYLCSRDESQEESNDIIIHRKWNGNWYDLTSFKEISENFKTLNIEYDWIQNDSWIFERRSGKNTRDIIVFSKCDTNPVMQLIVDENNSVKIIIDGFVDENDWLVLCRESQSENLIDSDSSKNLQKHLDKFSRNNYILAKDNNNLFVIICMNLRFPEDMRRPVIFREKSKGMAGIIETRFEILNIPGTELYPNQSLVGNSSIPGGLVIISDSKKALILANAEMEKDSKATIQLEKIPILDDKPAPQSRKHRMLLAYYMILQFEFNSARVLLHPFASINHNEIFSIEEISILKWITEIELEAPEASALKLFVFIHYKINHKKFPFEHSKYKIKFDISAQETNNYMFAIRELSEKYYIFKVFPEVLKEPLFSKLFENILNISFETSIENDSDLGKFNINTTGDLNNRYRIGDRIDSTFIDLVLSRNYESLNVASRLMLRRTHKVSFEKQTEMAVFCHVNDPDLWAEFDYKVFTLTDQSFPENERAPLLKDCYEIYVEIMNICIPKYNEFFKGINQSFDMTSTSLDTLKSTFESEISKLRLNFDNDNAKTEIIPELLSPLDLQTILEAETTLRSLLKTETEIEPASLFRFDAETVESSSVLAKLQKSIKDFIEEKGQNSRAEIFINNNSTLDSLKTLFSNRKREFLIAQETSASDLITMTYADASLAVIGSILSLMHQRKAKTFESLYACYFKDSIVCIQKKFPQLNLEQCIEVKETLKIFYSRRILINYFEMLEETVESFLKFVEKNEPISVDDLNIFCDELSKIKDFNSRMRDPVIMNFEFRSQKYRLKPEQVNDVGLLTTKDQNTNRFPSVVIQRMMAAGKTLVLGTISVVKKALDSTQLSILIPPSSLYQSNTTAMQNRTYQYFKKKGINFTFSRFEMPKRENPDSAEILMNYLKFVLELITNTMDDNNYMILSPDTLHSFMNSYIETLLNAEYNWDEYYQEILRSYAQIYRIFKERGSIVLDEIDMTMDPKKELNFPTQETEPYNMVAVSMLTDIMEFIIFDENIIEAGLRIHSNNQASLTATSYRDCVELVLKYVENQLYDNSSIWYNLVYGAESHGASVNDIMEFLNDSNMTGSKEWITDFHDSGNEILANALIIVKNQLHHQLKHYLMGTVNLNFGSSGNSRPEINYAVPYVAANTPSPASVFADRWETLLKTLLMVAASPCGLKIANEFIDYVQNAILREYSITQSLETTVTYRNLKLILPDDMCPLSLDNKNSLHVQAVQQALATRTPAAIRLLFTFYITQIFDNMTFPTEQITSNALNVVSMFNSVQGYSGTIDNVNILPQHVVRAVFEDNIENEKNNGGIALKLVRDCGNSKVQELNEEAFTKSVGEMVQDLMMLYPSNDVSAIIDAGAFFKNFKNIQVAKAILTVCSRIKAVLYYDEYSNQLEFLRASNGSYTRGILETSDPDDIRKATEVEIGDRFTFYDQRHITGSDILQPKTAHAIMTAGPRVLLRDILQGALRMRQFMTSQKVHLITTAASISFYSSKIKNKRDNIEMRVLDVLVLGALNEEEKQGHENVKLAFAKINAEIRAFVLDEISRALLGSSETSCDFVLNMTKSAKSLFLRTTKEFPLDLLQESRNENASSILNLYAISRIHPLKKVMDEFKPNIELQQRFNSMKKRIKEMISPDNKKYYFSGETIRTPLNLDEGAEVQQQTLTLTIIDLNMDNQVSENLSLRKGIYHSFDLVKELESREHEGTISSNEIYISLRALYNEKYLNESMKPYLNNALTTLGDHVGVTRDLIELFESSWEPGSHYPIFSKYTFEGSHILVKLFGNDLKLLLISSKAASNVIHDLEYCTRSENSLSSIYWLCDLSGTVTVTNDTETERGENVLDFIPQIDNLMFDLLIFNGSLPQILANPKLKAIYQNWLKSEHFKMRAMFLRLRMKALMEKDKEIFELDDQNLISLQECSMGIQKVVDGYPKDAVDFDFEARKIELFSICPITQQTIGIKRNSPIYLDLNSEIRKIWTVSGDEGFNLIEDSDFISEQVEIADIDEDLDEREVIFKVATKRATIFNISEYSMAVKNTSHGNKSKEEKFDEIMDTEIVVDDSMAEYQEPALTPIRTTEISLNLGVKSEEEEI